MKKKYTFLIIFLIISSLTVFAERFVHPLDFTGSDKDKQAVITYIKKNVKDTYTAIGMGDPATLRMMENEELNAFKQLTKATNRTLLDEVIQTYCNIGMCSYTTILMMYDEQLKASQQQLSW